MPEAAAAAVALLVGGAVLTIVAIRFGILLGGMLARTIDRDEEEPGGRGH
jgi:hypothetical protein